MKSHPIRYSPKYFADFTDAFKPVAKVGTKLNKLVQQARKGVTRTGLSAQQKRDLQRSMIHDPIDGLGDQWAAIETEALNHDYYQNEQLEKLKTLCWEVISADGDCNKKAENSKEDVFSCSNSADFYRGKVKPTYDMHAMHQYAAVRAVGLMRGILTSGTAEQKKEALKEFENLMEWVEDLPLTNKPDRVYLTSNEGCESTSLGIGVAAKPKNQSESTSRSDASSVVSVSQSKAARKPQTSESFSSTDSLISSTVEENPDLKVIDAKIKLIDAAINPGTNITAKESSESSLSAIEVSSEHEPWPVRATLRQKVQRSVVRTTQAIQQRRNAAIPF